MAIKNNNGVGAAETFGKKRTGDTSADDNDIRRQILRRQRRHETRGVVFPVRAEGTEIERDKLIVGLEHNLTPLKQKQVLQTGETLIDVRVAPQIGKAIDGQLARVGLTALFKRFEISLKVGSAP